MGFDFLTTDRFVEVESFAYRYPPSWTRLEPQTKTGDPRPGIEARVHDPLWLISRQWQLGELEGEDAGTPLTVRAVTTTVPVDRWAAADGDSQRLRHHDLLEPGVESEPVGDPAGPGLRARIEAGSVFLAALRESGLAEAAAYATVVVTQCPLSFDPAEHPGDGRFADLDPEWQRWRRLLDRPGVSPLLADAETLVAALEADGGLPAWLVAATPDDDAALRQIAADWSAWYRAEVSPVAGTPDAWVGERLEYQFRIGAGDLVLTAPSHLGGEIGWSTFDAVPGAVLAEPPDGGPAEASERQVHALLASPLRYPGMPADRLWEMEDAQVNLGLIEAEPWDLARLLVAEFALTYGNDWLAVPVDVPYGTVTRVESIYYLTTFGERFQVQPTEQTGVVPDGDWRLFALTAADGETVDGLLIPPGAVAVQDGPPIEEVLFLRDEMANLAWAVERSVQGPSGSARLRDRERDGINPASPKTVPQAELDYTLQTLVPARWIPYLPRTDGYRSIELVQGRMPDAEGTGVDPLGVLLTSGNVTRIADAEIPREGIAVRRLPSVTRQADGTYRRWLTRRISVGRGEGASQLYFDAARSRRPRPNAD
ncbi:MAG TPA: hypothetical protein VEX66_17870 [Microlunatus sp.]|nr:hypothetical protein [Microlunatus sp.]